MRKSGATPVLTSAECVLVHTAATVATTVHSDGEHLVVHVLEDVGVTSRRWPCHLVTAALRTPGIVRGDDDVQLLIDPDTTDLVATLDGHDGGTLLAVPGAAVRAALAR